MSKQTVREFITEYNKRRGSDPEPCEDSMIEIIQELGDEVWTDPYLDEYRWYSIQEVVVKLDDTYIKYGKYIITGDNSMSDMGLEYNIDTDFHIVERKERVITEIYYE